jgi:hypothetical protein
LQEIHIEDIQFWGRRNALCLSFASFLRWLITSPNVMVMVMFVVGYKSMKLPPTHPNYPVVFFIMIMVEGQAINVHFGTV